MFINKCFKVQCIVAFLLIVCYHCSKAEENEPKRARYLIPFLRTGRSKMIENIGNNFETTHDGVMQKNYPSLNLLTLCQLLCTHHDFMGNRLQHPYTAPKEYTDKGNELLSKREDYTPRLGRNQEILLH